MDILVGPDRISQEAWHFKMPGFFYIKLHLVTSVGKSHTQMRSQHLQKRDDNRMSDFASAASRHLRAATAYLPTCPDTAGYLLGYVAECSVKAVIDIAGFAVKRHVDQISPEHLLLAADLSLAARRYPVDLDADLGVVRDGWSTTLRYSKTGTLDSQKVSEFHRLASNVYRKTVEAMVLDGLIDVVPR